MALRNGGAAPRVAAPAAHPVAAGAAAGGLGFGRVIVSDIETPSMLADLVQSG
jgi:hypothetical protein